MAKKEDENELKELSDIYDVLKSDARWIILDLQGGVAMWREASAGAVASAGFIVILIFFYLRFSASQVPQWEATLTVGFWAAVGVLMSAIAAWGFARYFQLRRRYADLFRRAKDLE